MGVVYTACCDPDPSNVSEGDYRNNDCEVERRAAEDSSDDDESEEEEEEDSSSEEGLTEDDELKAALKDKTVLRLCNLPRDIEAAVLKKAVTDKFVENDESAPPFKRLAIVPEVFEEESADGGKTAALMAFFGQTSAKQVLTKLTDSPLCFEGFQVEPWLDCKFQKKLIKDAAAAKKKAEEDALAAEAARLELLAKQEDERLKLEEEQRLKAASEAEACQKEQELTASTLSEYIAAEAALEEALHADLESTSPDGVTKMLTEASDSEVRKIINDGDLFPSEDRSAFQAQLSSVPSVMMQRKLLLSMCQVQIESFKKSMKPKVQELAQKVEAYSLPACQAISEHHFNSTKWPWTDDTVKWDEWARERNNDARGFVIEHSLFFFLENRYEDKWQNLYGKK